MPLCFRLFITCFISVCTSVCGKVFFVTLPVKVNMGFVAKAATSTDAARWLKNFGATAEIFFRRKAFFGV